MDHLPILLFLSFSACFADNNPIINGGSVTDAPLTEVNPVTVTIATSTVKPTNSTTTKPDSPPTTTITTSTTAKPNATTVTTTPTPKTSVTTTLKPTEPTIKPPPSPVPNPTAAPATTTAVPHHDRKFDGPSFVGGIILALGMVAIGFVAFKFYKARNEMNYHTL